MSDLTVLDASAVVAYLLDEVGEPKVAAAIAGGPCAMTTVNTCEVLTKLSDKGTPLEEVQAALDEMGLIIVNFDEELANIAASLRMRTKHIGASLGDRACLALAQRAAQTGAVTVCTAERACASVKWPFKVILIR